MEIIAGETLQIFFLGTSGALPTITRNLPCILLKWGSHDLIFDCGEGSQRQMMKARAGFSPECIYITHWHADHFLGIIGLLQTMSFNGRKEPLVIAGPDCVHEMVSDIKELCRTKLGFFVDSKRVRPGDVLVYEGYSINVFAADHGIPAVGYIFEENSRLGRFNREGAIELGVRPGPLFGVLQRGTPVTITINGTDKVITPDMVMGSPRPGRKVIYTGDTRPYCLNFQIWEKKLISSFMMPLSMTKNPRERVSLCMLRLKKQVLWHQHSKLRVLHSFTSVPGIYP